MQKIQLSCPQEMSSLSVEEAEGESIVVTVFEMALEEVSSSVRKAGHCWPHMEQHTEGSANNMDISS